MPTHIEILGIDGKFVCYESEKPLAQSEWRAIIIFNQEQKREISRQQKQDQRYRDHNNLEDLCDDSFYKHCPVNISRRAINSVADFSISADFQIIIQNVLNDSTPIQCRRFNLWLKGYSYAQVARLQGCKREAVRQSVNRILQKIKKSILTDLPNGL